MLVRTLALVLATAGLLVPTAAPATATPDNYTPPSGPTFNSPLGTKRSQQAIFRKIIRSINSTPRGHEMPETHSKPAQRGVSRCSIGISRAVGRSLA